MITRQHPDGRIEIISPFDFYLDPGPEIISMTVTPIEPEDPQRRTAAEVRAIIEEQDRRLMKLLRPRLQAYQNAMMGKLFEMIVTKERERDPRVDPKVGDELRKPRRRNGVMLWRRILHFSPHRHRGSRRRKGVVYFVETIGDTRSWNGCSLKDWRAWAKGAQVRPRFPGAI